MYNYLHGNRIYRSLNTYHSMVVKAYGKANRDLKELLNGYPLRQMLGAAIDPRSKHLSFLTSSLPSLGETYKELQQNVQCIMLQHVVLEMAGLGKFQS